ncbi:MAG TPA: hypothetical protein VGT79_05445 [Xanthomonadaceae bacterium]|nr:hypothetical protein [Xanthomonadaceae bacterium]
MELDDMKAAWQTLHQRLETQAALNLLVFKDSKLDRMRRGLRPLVWGQAIQIVAGALIALWGGSFWVDHKDVPHLLIAGLLVHAAGISMIAFGAMMEALIARIDYSAPVLTIQRQLAQLRKVYVRGGLAIGLPWWVLWVPFVIVFLKTEFGADLFVNAPGVVWINIAAGFVGMLLTWMFIHWAGKRPQLAKRLEDGAAGGSLNRAQTHLDEIARFEQE